MHGKSGTLQLLSVLCSVVVESAKPDGHHTYRSGQVDKKKEKRGRQNFEPALTGYRPSATGSLLITKSSPEISSVFIVSGFSDVQRIDLALEEAGIHLSFQNNFIQLNKLVHFSIVTKIKTDIKMHQLISLGKIAHRIVTRSSHVRMISLLASSCTSGVVVCGVVVVVGMTVVAVVVVVASVVDAKLSVSTKVSFLNPEYPLPH